MKSKPTYTNVDEYIQQFDGDIAQRLIKIRSLIRGHAKGAEESIAYLMPAYKLNGPLVYFAALKSHIGFYPTPSGVSVYPKETAPYRSTKGAIQFPLDKPLPVTLITKIVKFRVKENLSKIKPKKVKVNKRKST